MTPDRPLIRRALDTDARAVADVWLRSFAAALPGVRRAHTDAEVRAWIRDEIVPHRETWVAAVSGTVVGMMVLNGSELEQLYLAPDWRGHGIGDRLIELAKRRSPGGLALWTFQVNTPAQRFYRRHGFVETERTDGSANEEREPDVRFVWRPQSHRRSPSRP